VIDPRYAEGYRRALPELAADLVRDKPDVIFAVGPRRPCGGAGDQHDSRGVRRRPAIRSELVSSRTLLGPLAT